MQINSSFLGCPLTWRRALCAQAAAASSTPRGTRILAEAGRFDTLGFSPAHQLQVDVLGSSGLLLSRDWPRPEEPDPVGLVWHAWAGALLEGQGEHKVKVSMGGVVVGPTHGKEYYW